MNWGSFSLTYEKAIYLWFAVLIAGILAVLDRLGFADAGNYVIHFNDVLTGSLSASMDVSFAYLSQFVATFGDALTLMLFYSLLSVSLKLVAIYKYSPNILLSLLIYLSFYFTLHDIIQIRVAVACAFFLFFIFALIQQRRIVCVFYFLSAVFFHLQAIFIIPFLIYTKIINTRVMMLSSLVLSYALGAFYTLPFMYFLAGTFSDFLPGKVVRDVTRFYESPGQVVLLNQHVLLNIAIAALYLFAIKIENIKKEELLFIKTICFALCAIFLFQEINVFAWRVFEFFNIIIIFLLPYMVLRTKPRYISMIFISLYIVANFYSSLKLWDVF